MLAMPLIQKLEQGLATRVGNAVSAFFAPTNPAPSGQNVPSQAPTSSAPSAQSSAPNLSNGVTAALLNLQSDAVHGHHHGAYRISAAAALSGRTNPATTVSIKA